MQNQKTNVFATILFLAAFLMGCKDEAHPTEGRPSSILAGSTPEKARTQKLNANVSPDTTSFLLDVNQDGTSDLEFRYESRNLGFRTAQPLQSVQPLHAQIQLAVDLHTDSLFLFSGDTIFDSFSNSYYHESSTNCTGQGLFIGVNGPADQLRPLGANTLISNQNQRWGQERFFYKNGSYRLPVILNGSYNNHPFQSWRTYAAPCSDFPDQQVVYLAFLLNDAQLGYVELSITNAYQVKLVRCVVQE